MQSIQKKVFTNRGKLNKPPLLKAAPIMVLSVMGLISISGCGGSNDEVTLAPGEQPAQNQAPIAGISLDALDGVWQGRLTQGSGGTQPIFTQKQHLLLVRRSPIQLGALKLSH